MLIYKHLPKVTVQATVISTYTICSNTGFCHNFTGVMKNADFMKTKLYFYSLLGLFLFLPFLSFADTVISEDSNIKIEGKWDESGERSLFSSRPTAYLVTNNIYILFPKTIFSVTVRITDIRGNRIYENIISQRSGSRYLIPYSLCEGEYILTIDHQRGHLTGMFNI